MRPFQIALPCLIIATLSACATPRYQSAYRNEPPTDAAGRSCLTLCERNLESCRDACVTQHTACVQTIAAEARLRYDESVKFYQGELAQYGRDLDSYHLSLSLGWGFHNGGHGAGWYDSPWPHAWPHEWPYGGYGPHSYPPVPPEPPSYAEELARLRAAKCDRDCGCQPNYDACFLSCGGRKVPQLRCIANCPPAR